jgi:hypothetical protein
MMKKGTTTPTVRTEQCPEQDPIQQVSSVLANPTKHPSLPGAATVYFPVRAIMVQQHTINLSAGCVWQRKGDDEKQLDIICMLPGDQDYQ